MIKRRLRMIKRKPGMRKRRADMRIKISRRILFITALSVLFAIMLVFGKNETALAVTSVVTQSEYASDSVTMHWTKVPGAKVYYPGIATTRADAENEAKKHAVSVPESNIKYTFKGLKPGTEYYVALRCVYKGLEGDKEETVNISIMKTLPGKITGLTQSKWYANKKTVYVTWDSQSAAYFRYVFMDKSGKRIREGVEEKNSFSGKIDNKKCYSFKVRAEDQVGGKTYEGDWSETIYLFAQPMIKSYNYGNDFAVKIEGKALKIKWNRVKYANSGYNIYVSQKRDKEYVKVAHADKKKNSKTIKTFRGNRFKKSGTYYIYVEGLRKQNGRVSSSGIGYVWEYKNGTVKQTYYHGD